MKKRIKVYKIWHRIRGPVFEDNPERALEIAASETPCYVAIDEMTAEEFASLPATVKHGFNNPANATIPNPNIKAT